jgi:lysylphosphatidylglycerol synthetase-like protein (DUF2156 family)
MDITKGKPDSTAKDVLIFVVIFLGLVAVISLLSVTVSSKILLLGAAFIALAVWGKRKLKRERKS